MKYIVEILVLIASLAGLSALFARLRRRKMDERPRKKDPYGLFHLALNKLPGEDLDAPPKTEWLNMGYWKDTECFPEAARALAMKTIAAANLKEGGTVVDVGHGTGESLLLLLSEPSIPHPSHLVGITSLPAHHQRSLERVQRYQESTGNQTKVTLHARDAIYDGKPDHPFDKSFDGTYDSIIALDSAYHFHTRRTFLKTSLSALKPGGRIALADICFLDDKVNSQMTRRVNRMVGMMPRENVKTKASYIAEMEEVGYEDIVLEDISKDVFPGFARFLKSRGWGWWAFGMFIEWYYRVIGARFVVLSGRRTM